MRARAGTAARTEPWRFGLWSRGEEQEFSCFLHFYKSGQQDLNLRPLGPQPSALPSYAIPREVSNDSIIADNFGFEKRFTSSFLFDIMIYDTGLLRTVCSCNFYH